MNKIDWQYMVTVFPTLIQYLPITIFMAIVSMVFAIIIGVVFALITKNRIPVLYQFAKLYISFSERFQPWFSSFSFILVFRGYSLR